ncbi:hypothetical protein AGABI1DRAFT_112934 [Agaricus bisporus var. burnettii JB137-S8]|uniref:Carboxylic ester hydrolase n=1 Tax=Agaricus bisporus var. burnettii (strain JB137-S8 / ATCC MYA-4627 / FGSC 10392) TaxID=597362 RepID=K5W389_AGABU|nr:uncharacterized protein AGABI1DRAFT_112934 [Agaricus bisporus var. burnettii JB137-S8]EKM81264.1 hypothetical protein AGABI1DRAFT_112934 [Agaricus bisporus var. burnettii JB137-S8]
MRTLCFLLTGIWTTLVVSQDSGLRVQTQQGEVLGSFVTPTVRQFLGIPYAVADRWEAPNIPPRREELFKADRFGDSCIQMNSAANLEFLNLTGSPPLNVTESENCMSVNVWSPSIDRKQRTAVMIWIYGGGFQFGTSNFPTYDGQFFVRDNDDVTLVTFNYRLNVFGQPHAPQLANSTTGVNFGLLDIDAAIQWVHDNIANFGGDPARMVLFGQSAGSAAIDLYTIAHPDDERITGVIEQSGSVSGGSQSGIGPNNSTNWNTLADAVGCGTNPDDAQLACMKQVPGRTLEDAVVNTNSNLGLVIDNITVFGDITSRVADGNFLKVLLLVGSTQHEGDIIVVGTELLSPLGFAQPLVTELLADLFTYSALTCPTGAAALVRTKAGVPAWRYHYQAVFRDISTRPDLRAWHASELPIVFGTYNQTTEIAKTPEEIALSSYIQSAWVAFARDPENGLSDFGWPTYDPTGDSLIELGNFFNKSGATFGRADQLDLVCSKSDTLATITALVSSLLLP